MVRITNLKITLSKIVNIPRVCSNFGRQWTAMLNVSASATGRGGDFSEKAKTETTAAARKALDLKVSKKAKDVTEQVLCRFCGHFSLDAMSHHFSKGYASGILKKYKGRAWKEIFMFLGFGILAPIIFFIFASMAEKPGIAGETETLLIGACSALALAVLSLWNLAEFIRTTSSYRTIAKMVRSLTDEKQLHLAVECYHANGDSLAVGEPWVKVLTSFKGQKIRKKKDGKPISQVFTCSRGHTRPTFGCPACIEAEQAGEDAKGQL